MGNGPVPPEEVRVFTEPFDVGDGEPFDAGLLEPLLDLLEACAPNDRRHLSEILHGSSVAAPRARRSLSGLASSKRRSVVRNRRLPVLLACVFVVMVGLGIVLRVRRSGTALGAQNAATSLGQASGVLLGTALFVWKMNSPYLIAGGLLVSVALIVGSKSRGKRGVVRPA